MPNLHAFIVMLGYASLVAAAGYVVLAVVAVLAWQLRGRTGTALSPPPVSVLKPLCGAEPGLYEHLRSFCQQDYPEFQIVFGVCDLADPAYAVVQRLMVEFPSLPIDVVVNPQQHGSNLKTSNLINMLAQARHQ